MTSAEVLQAFVRERLAAAAEEISRVFGQTLREYERELERQRRLLELQRPGKQTQNTELPHSPASDGEARVSQDSAAAEGPGPAGPERLEPQTRGRGLAKRKRGRPKKKGTRLPAKTSLRGIKSPAETGPSQDASPAKKSPRETQTELPQPPVAVKEEYVSDQETELHPDQDYMQPVEFEEGDASAREGSVDSEQRPISPGFALDEGQEGWHQEEAESRASRKAGGEGDKGAESPALSSPDKGRPGKKSFECDFCGKSYPQMIKLDQHLRAHTGQTQYSCETCREVFRQRSLLKEHLKSHLRCHTCGKDFKFKCMLVKHLRSHTHDKPFSCAVCDKKFRNKPSMESHQRRHEGEERYVCGRCKRRFQHPEDLFEHMTGHPGEPHICKACGVGFASALAYGRHQKVHNKQRPHACTFCGKTFARRYSLVVHTRTHTGDKPYVCKFCGRCFNQASMLNKHAKKHEEEEAPDWLEATPQV